MVTYSLHKGGITSPAQSELADPLATEGELRASHRATFPPPYNRLNLPYHRAFAEDQKELLADEPAELTFDLLPTATVFPAGQRLRIRIASADVDNFANLTWPASPDLRLYIGGQYASHIMLPVGP